MWAGRYILDSEDIEIRKEAAGKEDLREWCCD
jgi:hypothetical protein